MAFGFWFLVLIKLNQMIFNQDAGKISGRGEKFIVNLQFHSKTKDQRLEWGLLFFELNMF